MSLYFLSSGIHTSIQDLGRPGYRVYGINPGGAADKMSLSLLNTLLGNAEDTPTLEFSFPAPKIRFTKSVVFALGGGDFSAEIDGSPVKRWSTVVAAEGSVLRFTEKRIGVWGYLAGQGGLVADKWLGSSSTDFTVSVGGHHGSLLRPGDSIDFTPSKGQPIPGASISTDVLPLFSGAPTIRVLPGPEFDRLDKRSQSAFYSVAFKISPTSNKMGLRLSGEKLELSSRFEMVSSGVDFGTIQLLPDGQLVILMSDHQTTGGYPRIANVISADLPTLVQTPPGAGIGFAESDIGTAELLLGKQQTDINLLRWGVELRQRAV
jgi:antagonist of KipI